ncbi:MAG: hypothetical protein KF870_08535 [Leadbetterella sp.]|nr:hypothetical protein [Leadbetterella sp.]
MKKLILVSWALVAAHFSNAQEKKQYEVKNFKGVVNITGPSSGLIIEGYAGTSVVIEAEGGEGKVPEKAAGLRMVTAGGLDNTGISATVEEVTTKMVTSINEKGEEKEEDVRILSIHIPNTNRLFKNYVVKVPHGLTTRFRENTDGFWGRGGVLKIQSFQGELDVNCSGCNLDISGLSGNVIASNSFGGTTRVEFAKLDQEKITSINTDGELEVLLPANTKANLKMSAERGNVYTDFDLKAVANNTNASLEPVTVVGSANAPARVRSSAQGGYYMEAGAISINSQKGNLSDRFALASVSAAKRRNLDRYDYVINDGGVYVSISSRSGNVYLKKK